MEPETSPKRERDANPLDEPCSKRPRAAEFSVTPDLLPVEMWILIMKLTVPFQLLGLFFTCKAWHQFAIQHEEYSEVMLDEDFEPDDKANYTTTVPPEEFSWKYVDWLNSINIYPAPKDLSKSTLRRLKSAFYKYGDDASFTRARLSFPYFYQKELEWLAEANQFDRFREVFSATRMCVSDNTLRGKYPVGFAANGNLEALEWLIEQPDFQKSMIGNLRKMIKNGTPDCAVRAVMYGTCLSYEHLHDLLSGVRMGFEALMSRESIASGNHETAMRVHELVDLELYTVKNFQVCLQEGKVELADVIRSKIAKNGELLKLQPMNMLMLITRNGLGASSNQTIFPSRSVKYLFQTTEFPKYLEEYESEGEHFLNWVIQEADLEIFVLLKDTFMAPRLKDPEFIRDLIHARNTAAAMYMGELPLLLRFLLENEPLPLPHELRLNIYAGMTKRLRAGMRKEKVAEALQWFGASHWKNMRADVTYTFTKEGKLVLGGFPTTL